MISSTQYSLSGSSDLPLKNKLIINAALTGNAHSKELNENLPTTPDEISDDARRCSKAGATVFHIHACDDTGAPTYKKEVFEEIISKIRKHCPYSIICVTTSGRIFKKFEERSDVLSLEGSLKPDFASLMTGPANFPSAASDNSPETVCKLAAIMKEKNIRPELEILEVGMLNYAIHLMRKGFLKAPLYSNLILGSLGTMPARIVDLCHLVHSLPEGTVWGAGGAGRFQLSTNIAAILMGGHVRVGLEDNLYYDFEKTKLTTNEELVKRIVRLANEVGRPIATPKEACPILGL